ncbi:FMN-dependent NADH-azoreductase [Phyllobacterium bourgognense]|uniref:FMN dependent NADH:quinone oxidoreductase n=1 Tax=Phyllobacterium bourgognense TaxID=314236 RepID=A0A368Z536_9HYPH|nr:FMN-dependent NADH-azoreductase [Phyllobacterium bourgognense]RCW87560.1 FMN-dependent NADH-azoreductase [Phyllobacterium bourgognense]
MSSILLVTSSPRGAASHSTRVATELANKLQAKTPGAKIVTRDLASNPLPHIDADYASGIYTPVESRSVQQQNVVGVSDAVVDELFAADAVVISTGMINFNISSTLKAWIDHIARAGRTFSYGAEGPKGLVTGKKVYVVIASGGVYSNGPAAAFDHATPYLKTALGFLGMTDVEVIRIEGVAMGPEAEEKAISSALDHTNDLALAA